ncbi:MAG: nucleoside phosphorylase [Bacteroidales bacterium]|nr:nucleoside phosphorylase [Bacteroidales bacterium]
MSIKSSELVLAPDGSLYHIHLTGENLADNILLVGDPDRVNMFKDIFDTIEHESQNRELHALTGRYHGTRFTALSTGMGCDNIDIVATELDAAANFDLATREPLARHRALRMVRIGTSGSLQADIDCGSLVASRYAIGLDGLLNYYQHAPKGFDPDMEQAFARHMQLSPRLAAPYCVHGSQKLLAQVADGMTHGITVTAPGFYGPQGRDIRLAPSIDSLNEKLAAFSWNGTPVTNLEMETSAIYGFANALGHEALTVCLIIANRPCGTFLNDYHPQMHQTIGTVMERLAAI